MTTEAADAVTLITAMTRLRARLRRETVEGELPCTWSQITTLHRIVQDGPTTVSVLAQAEHVRRQSMAETIAALRDLGFVESRKDPGDARKILIQATEPGRSLIAALPTAREAWLDAAMRAVLRPAERKLLVEAAGLMDRLADAEW